MQAFAGRTARSPQLGRDQVLRTGASPHPAHPWLVHSDLVVPVTAGETARRWHGTQGDPVAVRSSRLMKHHRRLVR